MVKDDAIADELNSVLTCSASECFDPSGLPFGYVTFGPVGGSPLSAFMRYARNSSFPMSLRWAIKSLAYSKQSALGYSAEAFDLVLPTIGS